MLAVAGSPTILMPMRLAGRRQHQHRPVAGSHHAPLSSLQCRRPTAITTTIITATITITAATKTDQQSEDDIESLKLEISKLRDALTLTTETYDRKIAELSYECNRRITAMNVEYDKLANRLFGAGAILAQQD